MRIARAMDGMLEILQEESERHWTNRKISRKWKRRYWMRQVGQRQKWKQQPTCWRSSALRHRHTHPYTELTPTAGGGSDANVRFKKDNSLKLSNKITTEWQVANRAYRIAMEHTTDNTEMKWPCHPNTNKHTKCHIEVRGRTTYTWSDAATAKELRVWMWKIRKKTRKNNDNNANLIGFEWDLWCEINCLPL